jgi:hypothetical protein
LLAEDALAPAPARPNPLAAATAQTAAAAAADPATNHVHLYECVGLLIALDAVTAPARADYLQARPICPILYFRHCTRLKGRGHGSAPLVQRLLQPLLAQAQEVLARQLYATDTPERPVFTDLLRHHLVAIASVAKGARRRASRSSQDRPRTWG